MQFSDLQQALEQQYNVNCLTWLEDLACQPSGTLYRSWLPFLSAEYESQQRFVLLNFRTVPQDVLEHVSWLIKYLDISPCFVLVVTDQDHTANWFESQINPVQVQRMQQNIEHSLPIDPVTPVFNTQNTMCAHAWTGIHVWPSGAVGPCCEYTSTVPDMNIRSHSIEQIMHSDHMQNLRQQFRQGEWPVGCEACTRAQQSGGESKKQLTPYKLQNIYAGIDWESDSVTAGFVGGHLGNLCNLRCRICSPVFSSSIAAEELKQLDDHNKSHPTYRLLADNRWSGNSQHFWQTLKQQANTVCNFEFLGGEPLLLQENLDFMQWLIDQGHSQRAIFEFVTNGTQYPEIFDQAHRFGRLTVTISIDNLSDRFEYERYGAKWNTVTDNVAKFVASKQINSTLHIGVCITVNIQNVLYLPELLNWIKQQGIDHYYFNLLHHPQYLSLDQLTPAAKTLVLERLSACDVCELDRNRLAYVIERVRLSKTSDGQEFCQRMQAQDRVRRQNFVLTHQEIAQAMGFVL